MKELDAYPEWQEKVNKQKKSSYKNLRLEMKLDTMFT